MTQKKKRPYEDSISEIHSSNIDMDNRVIYLQEKEDSSESNGIDFRVAQNFVKNVNILQNDSSDPITVYMQTVGGCWHSGMGIYDAIKYSKCKISIVGWGQICSMGTIILQAAEKRVLMPNSIFMCHYGSTDLSGEFLSSHNYASVDRKNMQTMVDIYSEKCQKGKFFKDRGDSLSKIKAYIKRKMKDGDWYMTAQQAVDYGFADHVFSNSLKI